MNSDKTVKIVLAEDQEINAGLIIHLVQKKGWEITTFKNGLEILNYYKENHKDIDIILMDIQMPIMDGIKSTKEIRLFEKNNNLKEKIIIAITAYAMPGDKEKFLNYNMNDYISKPVRAEIFYKKLTYHIESLNSGNSKKLKEDRESCSLIIEKIGIDEKIYKELITIFKSTYPKKLDQLIKLVNSSFNKEDINQILHSLKGQMLNLEISEGLKELQYISKNIETIEKDYFLEQIEILNKKLKNFIDKCFNYFS